MKKFITETMFTDEFQDKALKAVFKPLGVITALCAVKFFPLVLISAGCFLLANSINDK